MCGRYYVDTEEQIIEMREIINEINRKFADDPRIERLSTGEIRPTNVAPVIARGRAGIGPGLMAWGFPKWKGSGVIINARAETAAERPMFRAPLLERRLVVPTTGFFEWRHEGGRAKEKFLFRLPEEDMLYLCGLYTMFAAPDGTKEARFVILTTAANESVAPYHDRMPVLLRREEWAGWIEGGDAMAYLLREQPALAAVAAG